MYYLTSNTIILSPDGFGSHRIVSLNAQDQRIHWQQQEQLFKSIEVQHTIT